MACRLAGKPVPQRPAVPQARTVPRNTADQKPEALNGNTLTEKNLLFDLIGL